MLFYGCAGGQQAVRDHHRLIGLMSKYLGIILGTVLRIMAMFGLHKLIMRPITPTHEGEQALHLVKPQQQLCSSLEHSSGMSTVVTTA